MSERAVGYTDVESCVEATLARRICLDTPLGLGKGGSVVGIGWSERSQGRRMDIRGSITTAITTTRRSSSWIE